MNNNYNGYAMCVCVLTSIHTHTQVYLSVSTKLEICLFFKKGPHFFSLHGSFFCIL